MGWLVGTRVNGQIRAYGITVAQGCHVDASITQSPRKPKTKPSYEVVSDGKSEMMNLMRQAAMRVIEVVQPGVDVEARWVK